VVDQVQASVANEAAVAFLQVEPADQTEVLELKGGGNGGQDQGRANGAYPAMVNTDPKPSMASSPDNGKKMLRYQYGSKSDDASAVQRVFEQVMVAKADVMTAELLALSPDFHKYTVDFCKVNRTAAYSLSPELQTSLTTTCWPHLRQFTHPLSWNCK
jgi:hypothetical protein